MMSANVALSHKFVTETFSLAMLRFLIFICLFIYFQLTSCSGLKNTRNIAPKIWKTYPRDVLWFYGLPLGQKQEMDFAGVLVAGHHLGACHWRNEGLWNRFWLLGSTFSPCWLWGRCWEAGEVAGLTASRHRLRWWAQPIGPKCHSGLDFQTARNPMPQLVQVCCNTVCTNIVICQCYPLDPACPICPSLQA